VPEEKDAGQPGRARLPGFDNEYGRAQRGEYLGGYGPDYGPNAYGPPGGYAPGGYPPAGYASGGNRHEYARDRGIRASRRTSTWTAAALIAAVAATTGYLAHSMPTATTSGTTVGHTTTKHSGQSGKVQSGAPGVSGPVVTSGGSGAVGAGRSASGGDN
jgi:hypothetical protein